MCVCVYPPAIDLGEVTVWRGPLSVAQQSGMRVSSPDRRSYPAGQRWRLQMWDMSCDRATQPTRQLGVQTGHEQSSLM